MQITLAGDFMTLLDDFPDEFREVIGNPADDEEGCLDPVLVEQLQRAMGVFFESRFEAIPTIRLDHLLESPHLEVIFQRDGQQILFPVR